MTKIILLALYAMASIFAIVIALFCGMERIHTLSHDQVIALLGTTGAWIAGVGTFVAASIALWLARRNENVKLKCAVDLRTMIPLGRQSDERYVCFQVTNLGILPITINNIGWSAGTGDNKKHAMHDPRSPLSAKLPKRLEHSESANFLDPIEVERVQMWMRGFAEGLGITKANSKTLRAEIHTTTGHVEIVKPSAGFTDTLAKALSS